MSNYDFSFLKYSLVAHSTLELKKKLHRNASSKYKHLEIRKCCMHGVKAYPVSETCSDRARRIQSHARCISAFINCCEFANRLREEEPNKLLILARKRK
uniref:Anaphylatoxin-like domain-containing protein n=1 Tax=Pavo cristatus TaxID=9049 RepID=A0A8C9FNG6_PAVCR